MIQSFNNGCHLPLKKHKADASYAIKFLTYQTWEDRLLVSHALGKKHSSITSKLQTFFKPRKSQSSTSTDNEKPTSSNMCDLTKSFDDSLVSTSNEMRQSTLEFVITNSEKTKAEILWALNCVTSGYSNNSCSDLNSLFQVMFPDSEIAKLFQLGPDKIRYMVNFWNCTLFQKLAHGYIKKE